MSLYTDHLTTFLAYTAVNLFQATTSQATTKGAITTKPTTITQSTTIKNETESTTTDISPGEGCSKITVEIDGSIHTFPNTEFGLTVPSNVTCDNGLYS